MADPDPSDPKDIVRKGYDKISYAYRADEEDESAKQYHAWLDEMLPHLIGAEGQRPVVLDLGCGCGIPVAKRLASTCEVIGVDISEVQIERARKLVPEANFICSDMSALAFAPRQFDAVVAFYSIIHVPLEEQPELFRKIAGWLKPGGLFMATLGSKAWTGTEDNWLNAGATMYWSHTGEETYKQWLAEPGFAVLWTRFVPEGDGGHLLVLVRRPPFTT